MGGRFLSAVAGATALIALSTSQASADIEGYPTVTASFVDPITAIILRSAVLYAPKGSGASSALQVAPAPDPLESIAWIIGFSREQLRYLILCRKLEQENANLRYWQGAAAGWFLIASQAAANAEATIAQTAGLENNPAASGFRSEALAATLTSAKMQLIYDAARKLAELAADRREKLRREKLKLLSRVLRRPDEWRDIIAQPERFNTPEFIGLTQDIAALSFSDAVTEAMLAAARKNNFLTFADEGAFAAGGVLGRLSGPDLIELVKLLCAEWERADEDLANIERIRLENIEELQRLNADFEAAGRAAQVSTSPDAQLDVMDAFDRLSNHEVSSALYEQALKIATERSRQWKQRKDEAIAQLEKTVVYRPPVGSGIPVYSLSPDAAVMLRTGINSLSDAWLAALEQAAVIEALDKVVEERTRDVEDEIAGRRTSEASGGAVGAPAETETYFGFVEAGFGYVVPLNDPDLDPFNQFEKLDDGIGLDLHVGGTFEPHDLLGDTADDLPFKLGWKLGASYSNLENDRLENRFAPGFLETTGDSETFEIGPGVFLAFPLIDDISGEVGIGVGAAYRNFELENGGATVAEADGWTWTTEVSAAVWKPIPGTAACFGLGARWQRVGEIDGSVVNGPAFDLGEQDAFDVSARLRLSLDYSELPSVHLGKQLCF